MLHFCVITVVLNDEKNILRTLNSVFSQDYAHFSSIIIDGKSTDSTTKIIENFLNQRAKIIERTQDSKKLFMTGEILQNQTPDPKNSPKNRVIFLSAADSGLYDAMNTGLSLCDADFCVFINSGDELFDKSVFSRLNFFMNRDQDLVFCGLCVTYPRQNLRLMRPPPRSVRTLYRLFSGFGHPNCIFNVKTHKNFPYDTRYKLAADYDAVYKMVTNGCKIAYFGGTVAVFEGGGLSDKRALESLREALKIAFHYNKGAKMTMKIIFFYAFSVAKKLAKKFPGRRVSRALIKFSAKISRA